MKMLRKWLPLLLALSVLLCSCSKKGAPEKINTKDFSREIQVESVGGSEIIHADQSTQSAQPGLMLQSTDGVRTGGEEGLTLNADGNKHIHVQENSQLRLEASGKPESGKTRIHLDGGSVLIALDEPLKDGELFQIQTQGSVISLLQGIVRVSKLDGFTLVEVFQGDAEAQLLQDGTKASAVAKPATAHSKAKMPQPSAGYTGRRADSAMGV